MAHMRILQSSYHPLFVSRGDHLRAVEDLKHIGMGVHKLSRGLQGI